MSALAASFVSTRAAHYAGDGIAPAMSLAVAADVGDLIIAGNMSDNAARDITGITGDGVTTYAQLRAVQSGSAGRVMGWGGYVTGAGGGQNVIITLSGAHGDDAVLFLLRITGPAANQSGLTSNGASGENVTTHDSGTATPASASNVIVGFQWRTNCTPTEDSGFTEITTPGGGGDNAFLGYIDNGSVSAHELNVTTDVNEFSVSMILAIDGLAAGGGILRQMMNYHGG